MTTNEEYVYRPLETATTVRILTIHAGKNDDPLSGELDHEDMEINVSRDNKVWDDPGLLNTLRPPPYEALSYVWGPPVFHHPLELENGILLITKSLDEALRRLRYNDRARRVWADAACINQRDLQERSAQVKLMGRIYERACMVIIWLGHCPAEEAALALETHTQSEQAPEPIEVRDARLRKILNLDWFKRIWVIQEAVIAINAKILWGVEEVDYKVFQQRVQLYNMRSVHTDSMWIGEMRYYLGFWEILHVLDWTRGLQCSDDRDRIYAVLGLPYVASWNPDASDIVGSIVPDYTKSVAEVYTDFASKCVKKDLLHKLWLLISHSSTWDPTATEIPSWVPDLSQPPLLFNSTRGLKRSGRPEPYGKTAELRPVLGKSEWTLIVQGYNIGTVTHVSAHCAGGDSSTQSLRIIADFWSQHIRHPAKEQSWLWSYIPDLRPATAHIQNYMFIKCLISCAVPQEDTWESRDNLTRLLTGPLDYGIESSLSLNTRYMVRSLNTSFSAVRKPPTPKPTYQSSQVSFEASHRSVQPVWKCHKLYTISGGKFGLGPIAMREGDIVVLVGGSKYPVILRPHEGSHVFVGNTYVSGVKEWEVDDMWEANPKLTGVTAFEIK